MLDYVPDRRCVELKSLKLYVWSYRNEGAFHEAVTNRILDDLAAATAPRFMRLTARFYVRGGIFTTVVAEHRQTGWEPQPRVDLERFAAGLPSPRLGSRAGRVSGPTSAERPQLAVTLQRSRVRPAARLLAPTDAAGQQLAATIIAPPAH